MSEKCVAMANTKTRCGKTGKCDGQCPAFLVAQQELETREELIYEQDE